MGRHRASGSGSPPRRTTVFAVGVALLVVASSGGLVAVIGTDGADHAERSAVVDSAVPATPRLVRTSHPGVSSWDGGFFRPPSGDDLRRVSPPPRSPPAATSAPPERSRSPQVRRTRPSPSRSCYVFRDRDGRKWRFCPRDR